MSSNSRFAVALHALVVMSYLEKALRMERVSSEMIARSVNTNPVVIRRILGALIKAGLVDSQAGKAGGNRLARPAGKITLRDVYQAVEEDGLFPLHENKENKICPVSRNIKGVLSKVFESADRAVEKTFDRVTLEELVREIPV